MADGTMDMVSSLRHKLNSLPQSRSDHCLYKVPEHIRKVNRECYQPSIVSIGPIYYKNSSLRCSQELKLRHLNCFLELGYKNYGVFANTLARYITIVQEWHDEARSYYEEKINLSKKEFVEMMMIDAAFIIYYFMCHSNSGISVPIDPMCKKIAWMVKVEQDFFLQDNQLPFFVLEKLYDLAFGKLYSITFKDLTCNFIGETYIPGREAARTIGRAKVRDAPYIMHLVDFLRICCLPPNRSPNQNREKKNWLCCLPTRCNMFHNQASNNQGIKESWICCLFHKHSSKPKQDEYDEESQFPKSSLKELKATGVQFRATDSKNLLDIKYENGVLNIPTLTIQDTTEAILRNIIFFEQCQYFEDSYFIDYVFFLDALIDTPEDVKILVRQGIIKHWLGSEDEVATIVNRLTRYIMIYTPNFYYSDISRRLNAHATTRWNKWRAILKRDYFNHPWSSLSVGYLVILLILTILQVYTGFKH